MKLAAADYYSPERVLCKACGVEIAGFVGEGRSLRFRQHPHYREVKIAFDDGTFHVTCLCDVCIRREEMSDPKFLQALHTADLWTLRKQVPTLAQKCGKRKAVEVVGVTTRAVALT